MFRVACILSKGSHKQSRERPRVERKLSKANSRGGRADGRLFALDPLVPLPLFRDFCFFRDARQLFEFRVCSPLPCESLPCESLRFCRRARPRNLHLQEARPELRGSSRLPPARGKLQLTPPPSFARPVQKLTLAVFHAPWWSAPALSTIFRPGQRLIPPSVAAIASS